MDKLFLVLMCFVVPTAFAEPKSLWCTDNDTESAAKAVQDAPANIRKSKQKVLEMEALRKSTGLEGYTDLALSNKKRAKEWELAQTMCLDAKWWSAKQFVFDTDGLKNSAISDVEYTAHNFCGAGVEDVRKVQLSSTPSIISFTWVEVTTTRTSNYSFNVERKTLIAGDKTNRDYTCELRDVDTSENIL